MSPSKIATLLPLSNKNQQIDGQTEFFVAPKSEIPAVDNLLGNQPPIFGPDDPTPDFRLHSPVVDKSATRSALKESESGDSETAKASTENTELNTDGEEVSDGSDMTAVVLASEQDAGGTLPDSLMAGWWPYLLIGVVSVGWVVAQLCLKRAPSFKHHVIPERTPDEIQSTTKGKFKVSTRFQKNEAGQEVGKVEQNLVTSVVPGSLGIPKANAEATASNSAKTQTQAGASVDRPTDDEFEFDFVSDFGDSDSDLLSEEQRSKILEAAEIIASQKKRKAAGAESRFK